MYWIIFIGFLSFAPLSEEQILPTNVAETRQKLLGLSAPPNPPMNTWSAYLSSQGFMANGFRPFNNIMANTMDTPVTEAPSTLPGGTSIGDTTNVNDVVPPTLSPEVRKQARDALASGMDIAEIAALKDYPPQFLERLEESLTESANAANAIIISSMSQNAANANSPGGIAGQQQGRVMGMHRVQIGKPFQQLPRNEVVGNSVFSSDQVGPQVGSHVGSSINLVQSRSPVPFVTANSSPPPLPGQIVMPNNDKGLSQNPNAASGAVNNNVVSVLKKLSRLWNEQQIRAKGSPAARNTFNQIERIIGMLTPQSKKVVLPIISRFMQSQNLNPNDRGLSNQNEMQHRNKMTRNDNPKEITPNYQPLSNYKPDQGIKTMNLNHNEIKSEQRRRGSDMSLPAHSNKTLPEGASATSLATVKRMAKLVRPTLRNGIPTPFSSRTEHQMPSSTSNTFLENSNPGFHPFSNERSRRLQPNAVQQPSRNMMIRKSGINTANSVSLKDRVVPIPVHPAQNRNVAVQWATTPAQEFETTSTPPTIIADLKSSDRVISVPSGTENVVSSGTVNSGSSRTPNSKSSGTVNSLSSRTINTISSGIVNPIRSTRVNSISAGLIHSARSSLQRQQFGISSGGNFQGMQPSEILKSRHYQHNQSSPENYLHNQSSNKLNNENNQIQESSGAFTAGNYHQKQSSNRINTDNYQNMHSSNTLNAETIKSMQSPAMLNSRNNQQDQALNSEHYQNKQSTGSLSAKNYHSHQLSGVLTSGNVQQPQSPEALNSGNHQDKQLVTAGNVQHTQSPNVIHSGNHQQRQFSDMLNSRSYLLKQSAAAVNSGTFHNPRSFEAANSRGVQISDPQMSSPSAVPKAGIQQPDVGLAQTSTRRHVSVTVSSTLPADVTSAVFSAAQEQPSTTGNEIGAELTTANKTIMSQERKLGKVIISSSLASSSATSPTDATEAIPSSMTMDISKVELSTETGTGQVHNLGSKASTTTSLPEQATKHRQVRPGSQGLVDGRVIQDTWRAFSKSLREMAAYGNRLLMLTRKIVKSQIKNKV